MTRGVIRARSSGVLTVAPVQEQDGAEAGHPTHEQAEAEVVRPVHGRAGQFGAQGDRPGEDGRAAAHAEDGAVLVGGEQGELHGVSRGWGGG